MVVFPRVNLNTQVMTDIGPENWIMMFQNLLYDNSCVSCDDPFDDGDLAHDEYFSREVTQQELIAAVKKLKTGKASGLDQVLNEMIICSVDRYPLAFVNLFNNLLDNCIFPSSWTKSMIVPLHKKGDKALETNYRGIAILSCLGKFFNVIINERISDFVMSNKIIKPEQLGFVKGNRTSDNLFILHSLVDLYCNKNGEKLYTAFIDFEKAYDKVSRNTMLKKLHRFGIRGKTFKVIESMYRNDQTCVRLGNKRTSFFDVNCGVKQGCILSPNLFNVFLSDLPAQFQDEDSRPAKLNDRSIGSLFWADDIVIISETKEGLQHSLERLQEYCDSNKLKVNVGKTKCMIFNKGGRSFQKDQLFFKEKPIEITRSFSYLGFLLTPSFSIKDLLNDLYKRALKAYYKMKTCLGELFRKNVALTLKLFDSLVKPILLYGVDVWGCFKHAFNDDNPIEKLNLKLCKDILGVKRTTSNVASRCELGRRQLHALGFRSLTKNLLRISHGKCNELMTHAYRSNIQVELTWSRCLKIHFLQSWIRRHMGESN